jgi:hypothetical protein
MNDTLVDSELDAALQLALSTAGKQRVLQVLSQLVEQDNKESTLTIIANEGVHHLAEEFKRGECFVASYGSLDLSCTESIHRAFRQVLLRTARKLKSQTWHRVYIVPFGPTPLSMQLKLLVYRVCGLESIEVMHVSGEPRADVSINLRELIVDSNLADDSGQLQNEPKANP